MDDGDGQTRVADMAGPSLRQAVEGLSAARRAGAGHPAQPRRPRSSTSRRPASTRSRSSRRGSSFASWAASHTIVLSTHILPEVSQTCQRVVIINKGKMVVVDTPDNLTARLRGTETMYLQIAAPRDGGRARPEPRRGRHARGGDAGARRPRGSRSRSRSGPRHAPRARGGGRQSRLGTARAPAAAR